MRNVLLEAMRKLRLRKAEATIFKNLNVLLQDFMSAAYYRHMENVIEESMSILSEALNELDVKA
jgi:hypothetical protein